MEAQNKHAGVSTSTVHLPNGTMRKQLGGFHFAGTEAAIFQSHFRKQNEIERVFRSDYR